MPRSSAAPSPRSDPGSIGRTRKDPEMNPETWLLAHAQRRDGATARRADRTCARPPLLRVARSSAQPRRERAAANRRRAVRDGPNPERPLSPGAVPRTVGVHRLTFHASGAPYLVGEHRRSDGVPRVRPPLRRWCSAARPAWSAARHTIAGRVVLGPEPGSLIVSTLAQRGGVVVNVSVPLAQRQR